MLPNFLYTEVTAWVGDSIITTSVLTMRSHVGTTTSETNVKPGRTMWSPVCTCNACRDGALTTSVGKAFQLSTTRNEKKFCLRLEQLHHSPHTKPSIHNIRFIVGACNGSQWKEAWCWPLNVLFEYFTHGSSTNNAQPKGTAAKRKQRDWKPRWRIVLNCADVIFYLRREMNPENKNKLVKPYGSFQSKNGLPERHWDVNLILFKTNIFLYRITVTLHQDQGHRNEHEHNNDIPCISLRSCQVWIK